MPIDLKNLTISKAHQSLKDGDFTSVELTKAYLEQIKKKDVQIHAYLEVFGDAVEQAQIADAKIREAVSKNSDFNILLGIPCAIKDNILIKDRIVSSASKILDNYRATYDATVIKKLKEAGAVFLGRTNMDEFAMGGSTENSAYGPTKNPYDLNRVSGGSSGGSAAGVSADMALFSIGSDTGGSIRQPASFCGVVGLKPTYGAVSRYGVMAMGSSLDQIGPFAKNVEDAQIVYEIIRGKDPNDGTSIDQVKPQNTKDKKTIIGVPRDFLKGDGIDPEIIKLFEKSLDTLKEKGCEIKDISLPNIAYSLMAYYIIMPAEVSSNMARYDGMRFGLHADGKDGIDDYFETRRAGLGREVIRRILLGTYVLSSGYYDAYYNRANAVRKMITEDFLNAFESVDVIATPTTPSTAFKLGEKTSDPVAMYLEDIFTVPANITGMPAISVPMKNRDKEDDGENRLPVGIQFTAPGNREDILFEIGKWLE